MNRHLTAEAHAAPDDAATHDARARRRKHWRHAFAGLFFAVVAVLLVSQARSIEWDEVWEALAGIPATTLLGAALLAALSHAIYSTYDLLGRSWIRHALPTGKVMAVNFVSYAFNLNLGSLVGAFAFRYRLYSRLGLSNAEITRVLGLSLVTNWLGYLLLAGGVFALGVITPPAGWDIGASALRVLGVLLMLSAFAYLLLCARSRRREWTLRGHVVTLPPIWLALRQLALSCANWLTMGAIITVLLHARVDYPTVLGTLLMAALAGVITHIPAGLGVLEAVFIALLGTRMPPGQLLAALLAYRALYYLVPLMLACILALRLEAHSARRRRLARTGTRLAESRRHHS
jgi:uncharacterized membrane protein YbhN (UPF0104 family)